ncbi:thioesterase family protein [Agrobacterium vitis]
MNNLLPVNLEARSTSLIEFVFTIRKRHLATTLGGDEDVIATAVLIHWAELAATQLLKERYEGSYRTSVGTVVEIKHLASALLHEKITVRVQLMRLVLGIARFSIDITAQDSGRLLMQGSHERKVNTE